MMMATVKQAFSASAGSTGAPAKPQSWRALLLSLPPAYVAAQVLGWGLYAAVSLPLVEAAKYYRRPSDALISVVLFSFYGLIATHLIRAIARRQNWADKPFSRVVPRTLVAAALGGIWMAGCLVVINSLGLGLFAAHGRDAYMVLLYMSPNASIMVLFWEFFYFLAKTSERRRMAEMQSLQLQLLAREAQHRALSSQLQPHFLFNCLNSLRSLIVEDPSRAREMVTDLAGLLRYSLDHDLLTRVALAEELAALDRYLALETIRFEDRLRIRRQVSDQALRALVPPMIVQSLVENAIKHGIAALSGGGEIAIQAERHDGVLRIDVWNDGRLLALERPGGIGLRNTRERLALLYGAQASLELFAMQPEKVCARLTLPFEETR
jgi:two-component system sensor histidine kinase AlgZ